MEHVLTSNGITCFWDYFFHRIPFSAEGKYSIGITIASKKLVTGKDDCFL